MIIFTIIGALIGAGFASGQEIYLFFYRFGKNGIWGIVLFTIIIIYMLNQTLKIIYKNQINTYKEFLDLIFNSSPTLNIITNIIVNCFLVISFFIMISGSGAYFNQQYGASKFWGTAIISILSYITFLKNVKFMTKLNTIIVPILIFSIILIGSKNIYQNIDFTIIQTQKDIFWILDSILYASYNLILLIPVLISLKNYLKTFKQIKIISLTTGIIVGILSLLIFLLLTNIDIDPSNIEMPVVYIIEQKFIEFKNIYGIIIIIAIFTTAISVGIGFLNNITKNKKSFQQNVAILCISSVIVSSIGFSNLVKILFPLFGYLGLLQIYFITKNH